MDGDFEDRVQRRMAELAEGTFGTLETSTCAKRLAWCTDNLSGGARQWSPREAFELLFFSYMGLPRTDLPVREETGERISWESRNPCPTLEACLRLGLDTRRAAGRGARAPLIFGFKNGSIPG